MNSIVQNDFDKLLQEIDKKIKEMESRLNARLDNQDLQIRPFANLIMEAQKVTALKKLSHSAITNNPHIEKFVIPTEKKILVSVKTVDVMRKPKKR